MNLKIMGQNIKVKREKLEDGLYGDYKDYVIRISNSLVDINVIRSTLLHESMHAILHVAGHAQRLEVNDEEALVWALEHGLYPIIGKIGSYE